MTDLPNGFTGFSHRDPNFVSAGDALRGSRYDDTPFAARKQAQARNLAEAWSPAASERAGAGVAAEGGSDAAARGASRSLPQLSSAASDVLRFAEQGTQATDAPRFDPDKLARIPETDRRWAWVEIDLNAIRHNASAMKRRLNPAHPAHGRGEGRRLRPRRRAVRQDRRSTPGPSTWAWPRWTRPSPCARPM